MLLGPGGDFQSYFTMIGKLLVIKNQTTLAEFDNLRVRVPTKEDGVPFVVLGRDSIFFKYDIMFQESLSQIRLVGKKSK